VDLLLGTGAPEAAVMNEDTARRVVKIHRDGKEIP
jgi:hypothetical protein